MNATKGQPTQTDECDIGDILGPQKSMPPERMNASYNGWSNYLVYGIAATDYLAVKNALKAGIDPTQSRRGTAPIHLAILIYESLAQVADPAVDEALRIINLIKESIKDNLKAKK